MGATKGQIMNYIHQLQHDKDRLTAELAALREGLMDLERYLNLDKFAVDPTVQVSDIHHRLSDAYNLAIQAHFDNL